MGLTVLENNLVFSMKVESNKYLMTQHASQLPNTITNYQR
jgi:hypothetical protein